MIILGIETSCDDTAVALIKGSNILSNVVSSQDSLHARYGGVVPELASRHHLELIEIVVDEALKRAGVKLSQVRGMAVTYGPGLVGSLLVGLSFAKSLSFALNIPFVGVNHLEGHLLSVFLEKEIKFPYLGLVVSGGHTSLYLVKGIGSYARLGKTLDDAAGEAFDKIAKFFQLGYPGGPVIDELASLEKKDKIFFPRPLLKTKNLDFSFSGLKTAVIQYAKREKEGRVDEIISSFQEALVETLVKKILLATKQTGCQRIVITGGVACNKRFRAHLKKEAEKQGREVFYPSPGLCTDNGAMIALAGSYYLKRKKFSDYSLNAIASLDL